MGSWRTDEKYWPKGAEEPLLRDLSDLWDKHSAFLEVQVARLLMDEPPFGWMAFDQSGELCFEVAIWSVGGDELCARASAAECISEFSEWSIPGGFPIRVESIQDEYRPSLQKDLSALQALQAAVSEGIMKIEAALALPNEPEPAKNGDTH